MIEKIIERIRFRALGIPQIEAYVEFSTRDLKEEISERREVLTRRTEEYLVFSQQVRGYSVAGDPYTLEANKMGKQSYALIDLLCRLPDRISPMGLSNLMVVTRVGWMARRSLISALMRDDS